MTSKAKGAIIKAPNQPLVVEELEWDDLRETEVGVRIAACGICRSDYHAIVADFPTQFPILLGHEGAGIVEKVGKRVTSVKPGDKVVMSWVAECLHCPACIAGHGELCDTGSDTFSDVRKGSGMKLWDKNKKSVLQFVNIGALSEYVVMEEIQCVRIPDDMDLSKMAVLGCRVPTGFGAVSKVAQVKPGSSALVVGLGGIGFNIVQGLKICGASIIIGADIVDKSKWAKQFGVTHFINASKQNVLEEVHKILPAGVDYAFDAIGNTQVQSLVTDALQKRGKAVWIGTVSPPDSPPGKINSFKVVTGGLQILGVMYGGASAREQIPQLIMLYRTSQLKLGELITKEYSIDKVNDAFNDMLNGRVICGQVRFY